MWTLSCVCFLYTIIVYVPDKTYVVFDAKYIYNYENEFLYVLNIYIFYIYIYLFI